MTMSEKESDFIKALRKASITFLFGLGLLIIGGFVAFYNQTLENRAETNTKIEFIQKDISEMNIKIERIDQNFNNILKDSRDYTLIKK